MREVDIARQLGMWLRTPAPDLDHQAPIQYLDVTEGRELVARLWVGRYHRQWQVRHAGCLTTFTQ